MRWTTDHDLVDYSDPVTLEWLTEGQAGLPASVNDRDWKRIYAKDNGTEYVFAIRPDGFIEDMGRYYDDAAISLGSRLVFHCDQGRSEVRVQMARQLPARLTPSTGAVIGFAPRLLSQLPTNGSKVTVVMPDGKELAARYRGHEANPYFTSTEVRHWLLTDPKLEETEYVLAHVIVEDNAYVLDFYDAEVLRQPQSETEAVDAVEELLRLAERIGQESPRRKKAFSTRMERNSQLADKFKKVFGDQCQVAGCPGLPGVQDKRISVVHHVEPLSAGGCDWPRNMAVLCGSHHELVHRDPDIAIEEENDGNLKVMHSAGSFRIVRDFTVLDKE